MQILTSSRLQLRSIQIDDAEFVLRLFNDPDCLLHIGDKGLRNLDDAINYIKTGPQQMYASLGLGLLVVESIKDKTVIGLCGLLKRPELPAPDLGFAFLPEFRKQGYAFEAAQAVLKDAFNQGDLQKVLAATSLDNVKSITLLDKLGFANQQVVQLEGYSEPSKLFELELKQLTLGGD